ncbi:MAG: heat shock protein transcriptional repressor HspR [Rubrobacter sp.]
MSFRKRPVFMIGIASELIGVHPQTLRMYEQKGLLVPRKSIKNTRLYSQEDIERGQHIQRLTQEMGLNLAGVRKILELETQVKLLEEQNVRLASELKAREAEYEHTVTEVHRSYRRELVLIPKAEIVARQKQSARLADDQQEHKYEHKKGKP